MLMGNSLLTCASQLLISATSGTRPATLHYTVDDEGRRCWNAEGEDFTHVRDFLNGRFNTQFADGRLAFFSSLSHFAQPVPSTCRRFIVAWLTPYLNWLLALDHVSVCRTERLVLGINRI